MSTPIPTPPFDAYLRVVQESLTRRKHKNRCGLNEHEHEECMQDVLVILCGLNVIGKLENNIVKICALAQKKLYSQRAAAIRRRRSVLQQLLPADDLALLYRQYPSSSTLMTDLRDCVEALPPDERTVIRLRFVAGLVLRLIAELLGVPEGTTYGILGRALRLLRDCMSGKDWDSPEVLK